MKLWAMPCRATQDRRVMVESSEKMWSTGEGNGKPFSIALRIPWTVWKGKKIGHWNDELPRSRGAQYATRDQWRNNFRKHEQLEPKQKQHPVVDVAGDGSTVQCCKEWYCIGTWMLGPWIKVNWKWSTGDSKSEHWHFRNQWTKWTGMGEFDLDDNYISYCGQESLRRNEVALIVNKESTMQYSSRCSLKNNRMISVHFQSKPLNIRWSKPSLNQ